MEITREVAAKVLETVDAGLVHGMGKPVPGSMCVEAAVCYALGLPHSDDPGCVSPALRRLKIKLNDSNWSSPEARAKGLRRLALVQLGSAGVLDEKEFVRRVAEMTIRKTVPMALRTAAKIQKSDTHRLALLAAADECEARGDEETARKAQKAAAAAYAADAAAYAAAYAADAAAYAAYAAAAYAYAAAAADAAAYAADVTAYAAAYAADVTAYAADVRDKSFAAFAEEVVQILIGMNAPGCQWLDLAPVELAA